MTNRIAIALSAFVLASSASLALAQDPAPAPAPAQQPAQQEQAKQTVDGELVKVDADTKMVTIKAADGAEQQFTYDDKTEIAGARDAQGLATSAGSKVTITYTMTNQTRTATKIEVHPAK